MRPMGVCGVGGGAMSWRRKLGGSRAGVMDSEDGRGEEVRGRACICEAQRCPLQTKILRLRAPLSWGKMHEILSARSWGKQHLKSGCLATHPAKAPPGERASVCPDEPHPVRNYDSLACAKWRVELSFVQCAYCS